ncbi:hypothetical protein [Streptomyces canus]|uniref:hypothetical protein n=1 Tax=Streptomyces canus TaxID=58343 RepID=UPI002E35FE52|nr:hypothetical protein [Streptomyces canus]
MPRVPVTAAADPDQSPDRGPLPMLILECETASAGLADPRRRTNWQAWDDSQLQEPDFNWRLRVDIATRSVECLVQIDPDGSPVLQSCDQPSTLADAMGFTP